MSAWDTPGLRYDFGYGNCSRGVDICKVLGRPLSILLTKLSNKAHKFVRPASTGGGLLWANTSTTSVPFRREDFPLLIPTGEASPDSRVAEWAGRGKIGSPDQPQTQVSPGQISQFLALILITSKRPARPVLSHRLPRISELPSPQPRASLFLQLLNQYRQHCLAQYYQGVEGSRPYSNVQSDSTTTGS
jgi:hypothetical protein